MNTKKWNPLLLSMIFFYIAVSTALVISYSANAYQTQHTATPDSITQQISSQSQSRNSYLNVTQPLQVSDRYSMQITSPIDYEYAQLLSSNSTLGICVFCAIFIAAIPQKTRNLTGTMDLRDEIMSIIQENPGIHFREICREVARKNGVVQYHLRVLEYKDEKIRSEEDGGYRRYFPRTYVLQDEFTREIALHLQKDTPQAIIRILEQETDPVTRSTLAEKIGVSTQAISWNCKQMVEKGLVNEVRISRERAYSLNPETLHGLNLLENPYEMEFL